ncbi:MAG TPA: hypothetical protein DCY00_04525 [Actinobacteria bacterium]|nr:hypothetical protein [Actinomycetota bacterium]
MPEHLEKLKKRLMELEIEIEEVKNLSRTRNILLETNIKELNDAYRALNEKLREIRDRDKKINAFEDEFRKANKLSTMGELAGSIAHEIKNPLISIQGFAKRITKAGDKEKIKEYAGLIDHEAGRLSNVLAKLLEFSRMDEPRKEMIVINTIVDDTVMFLEHHLTRFKNISLYVQKDSDIPMIQTDKINIQQSLVNIVMNATQAMPDGGDIRIITGKDGGHVFIAVTDKGSGINQEYIDKIFEPFFTTKKRGEGTGLGLSLSKRLVEASGGKIDVESKEGKGSTFKISLPVN